jgi:hypothetical protein
MKKIAGIVFGALMTIMLVGCWSSHEIESKHKVETVHEVKPIHIIIDINLKVDKELDDYFGDIDASEDKIESKSETANK